MEGTYPLIIDGDLVGKLTVSTRGTQTVFGVSCRMLPGIVRVSVYGGDREGYLGVLTPEGEGLGLHKTISRAALREFPSVIDTVERAGRQPQSEPTPEPEPAQTEPDVYWYASPDGALVCFDGERNLLALPEGDARIPADAAGERRRVEGRPYLVFPTKNGRVQWGSAPLP